MGMHASPHSSSLRAPSYYQIFKPNVVRHATVMSDLQPDWKVLDSNRTNLASLPKIKTEANDRAQASHGAPYHLNGGLWLVYTGNVRSGSLAFFAIAHVEFYSLKYQKFRVLPTTKKQKRNKQRDDQSWRGGLLCRILHVSGTKINKLGLKIACLALFFALPATQRESKDPTQHFLTKRRLLIKSETLLFLQHHLVS